MRQLAGLGFWEWGEGDGLGETGRGGWGVGEEGLAFKVELVCVEGWLWGGLGVVNERIDVVVGPLDGFKNVSGVFGGLGRSVCEAGRCFY